MTERIVKAALALNRCANEFDGDLRYCQELLDEFWNACDEHEAQPERERLIREDDARKSYDLAIARLRERKVRSGEFHPDPDNPEELRWAAEGPVSHVRELDTVRQR